MQHYQNLDVEEEHGEDFDEQVLEDLEVIRDLQQRVAHCVAAPVQNVLSFAVLNCVQIGSDCRLLLCVV